MASGIEEADVALAWALTGKWVLGKAGIAVFLTRDDDRDPSPVGQRDDLAEAQGCTHFLSLHCNSADTHVASGTETFYRDGHDKAWAQLVQASAVLAIGRADRGVKREGASQHGRLAIFDFDGPACLLELGFLSNSIDRARMLERSRRVAFWEALAVRLSGSAEGGAS